MIKILFILIFSTGNVGFAHPVKKAKSIEYYHSSVGKNPKRAIPNTMVDIRKVRAWRICLDAGSSAKYLALSSGSDPDTDGVRIGAGDCFDCSNCGGVALQLTNVKAETPETGYSVIKFI